MTQNQTPKSISKTYIVRAANGLWLEDLVAGHYWYTNIRDQAVEFQSLRVASQVSDAIGGEVVDV